MGMLLAGKSETKPLLSGQIRIPIGAIDAGTDSASMRELDRNCACPGATLAGADVQMYCLYLCSKGVMSTMKSSREVNQKKNFAAFDIFFHEEEQWKSGLGCKKGQIDCLSRFLMVPGKSIFLQDARPFHTKKHHTESRL